MKKIFLPLLVLLCLILPAQAAGFYDLPSSHWAGPDIQRALDAGVMNGYGDGSFQPSRASFSTRCSRAPKESATVAMAVPSMHML